MLAINEQIAKARSISIGSIRRRIFWIYTRQVRPSDSDRATATIAESLGRGRFLLRFDNGEEERVTLPDEDVKLLAKDHDDFNEHSSLSLDDQRRAWAAEAAEVYPSACEPPHE